jgi:hypothetical protein
MVARFREECRACTTKPVMRCGRCTSTRCAVHALAAGRRCSRCELDWAADAPVRSAAKVIFAPPAGILAGGVLFGLLLPVSIGGVIGAAVMAALACGTAVATGAGACRLVDRSARAMFLRERAGELPTARLLPSPRHR